jgi:acetyltransferase-like isoleucine patch superfamily enzyme
MLFKIAIKKLALKLYEIGKNQADLRAKIQRESQLESAATLHPKTIIDKQAYIQNSQNDRRRIVIGAGTQVKAHLMLFKHGGEIIIGDNCFLGPETKIWSAKKILIGDRVLISHNVNIHDNISHPLNSSARHDDFVHIRDKGFRDSNDLKEREVVICDDAWIGFNATILKGVRIGNGAIVGACSVVTQDVPDFAVVVGNPARIIKYVD